MKIPQLVQYGLRRDFDQGYKSDATRMLYTHVKLSDDQIEKMIRETWEYIKIENKFNNVLCHFLYLLHSEIGRELIHDISTEIVQYGFDYGLNHSDTNVIEQTIGLIESWHDKDLLDLLTKTEIICAWLNEYKNAVLDDYR